MSHSYRNYAHIEGIVEEQPTQVQTLDGKLFAFGVAVQRRTRDRDGQTIVSADYFNVEVESAAARLSLTGVKKGSYVTIDGSLRPYPSKGGRITVLAERVFTVDNSGWLKEVLPQDEATLERYKQAIHQVLRPADAEQFEWKKRYGCIQQYKNKVTGGNLFIDAKTLEFCSRKGIPMTKEVALNLVNDVDLRQP